MILIQQMFALLVELQKIAKELGIIPYIDPGLNPDGYIPVV